MSIEVRGPPDPLTAHCGVSSEGQVSHIITCFRLFTSQFPSDSGTEGRSLVRPWQTLSVRSSKIGGQMKELKLSQNCLTRPSFSWVRQISDRQEVRHSADIFRLVGLVGGGGGQLSSFDIQILIKLDLVISRFSKRSRESFWFPTTK